MSDIIQLSNFNIYLGLAITGIFTGLGSAIGSYLANAHLIKRGEKISSKFKSLFKNKQSEVRV
jgi:predicted hydrocarbon binding protein